MADENKRTGADGQRAAQERQKAERDKAREHEDREDGPDGKKDEDQKDDKKKRDEEEEQSKPNRKKDKDKDDDGGGRCKKKKKGPLQKLKDTAIKAAIAMHMAIQALKTFIMIKLMMLLKALIQAAINAVIGILNAIINFAISFVTTLATFFGVSVAVATGGAAVVFLAAVVTIGSLIVGMWDSAVVSQRDAPSDCDTDLSYMEPDLTTEQTVLSNAKLIVSFFRALDYTDVQIAGILGNWVCESGIDPTTVETCYSTPYGLDERKSWFEDGQLTVTWNYYHGSHVSTTFKQVGSIIYLWHIVGYDPGPPRKPVYEPTEVTVSSGRAFDVIPGTYTINFNADLLSAWSIAHSDGEEYFNKFPAIRKCGIGVGQWTNERCQGLLDYAAAHNTAWSELSVQLMYMISADTRSDLILTGWVDRNPRLYPDDAIGARTAAEWFMTHWEGLPLSEGSHDARLDAAEEWYERIKDWVPGRDYSSEAGESLFDIVQAELAGTLDNMQSRKRECSKTYYQSNSSAADAIISYAWGPGKAYQNDGTTCWQHIHSITAPGDTYLRSCDRTVACAVRWSGTDTNYPIGACREQLDYLVASDRVYRDATYGLDADGNRVHLSPNMAYWMEVTPSATTAAEFIAELQPGDVLIRKDDVVSHTLMFVGNTAIRKRWPDADARYCCVSGSINKYSPHVGGFAQSGTGSDNYMTYRVFRCMVTYSGNAEFTTATCMGYSNEDNNS